MDYKNHSRGKEKKRNGKTGINTLEKKKSTLWKVKDTEQQKITREI